METETLKIKCPHCGVILTIKSMPNLASKSIPCPVCKHTSPFTAFTRVTVKPRQPRDEDTTPGGYRPFPPVDDDATQLGCSLHTAAPGTLRVAGSERNYPLSWGVNTIGRKAQTSSAALQLEVDDRTMSRLHAVIEVKKSRSGCLHCISNAENKNRTYVNSLLLEPGDVVILHDGDRIEMGSTTLFFSFPSGSAKR